MSLLKKIGKVLTKSPLAKIALKTSPVGKLLKKTPAAKGALSMLKKKKKPITVASTTKVPFTK